MGFGKGLFISLGVVLVGVSVAIMTTDLVAGLATLVCGAIVLGGSVTND